MKNKKYIFIRASIVVVLIVLSGWFAWNRFLKPIDTRPNIIFILTDDMDYTLLPYMTNTDKLIAEQGATFTNYFVTSSACCPSRASTIRGQYPHNTGILENSPGFEQFYRLGNDEDTLAVWLKEAGYKNSFMGKYMNLYPAGVKRSYIPPGWSDWHVLLYHASPDFYFGYTMNENGKLVKYDKKDESYSADILRDRALEFIDKNARRRTPFFLFIAPYAPHGPSTPATRHTNLYTDLTYPKSESFHEDDTSDKPQIIRDLRKTGGIFEEGEADELFILRVQTMQAVDEMIADIVHRLELNGQLTNTFIFFSSDNGFHMGEHGLPSGKMLAYEEDIRVPFLVRGPGIQPGTLVTSMTANIDVAPSISELTGAQPADFVDGRSFVRFFDSKNDTEWRKALLLETGYLEGVSNVISYRGIRTETFKYVEYENGEIEFYDLVADPYEMNNITSELSAESVSALHAWLERLKTCKADACRAAETSVPEIQYLSK